MVKYRYIPEGVCSKEMIFEIQDDIVTKLEIKGGCPGNTVGISKLIVGRKIDDVIQLFKNIECGYKSTSCPDQIACALEKYKLESKEAAD